MVHKIFNSMAVSTVDKFRDVNLHICGVNSRTLRMLQKKYIKRTRASTILVI